MHENESTSASRREDYQRIGVFHNAQVVSSIPNVLLAANPGVAMLACIYVGPLMGNFCLLADASWAGKYCLLFSPVH